MDGRQERNARPASRQEQIETVFRHLLIDMHNIRCELLKYSADTPMLPKIQGRTQRVGRPSICVRQLYSSHLAKPTKIFDQLVHRLSIAAERMNTMSQLRQPGCQIVQINLTSAPR